jgi:hypothetical protein
VIISNHAAPTCGVLVGEQRDFAAIPDDMITGNRERFSRVAIRLPRPGCCGASYRKPLVVPSLGYLAWREQGWPPVTWTRMRLAVVCGARRKRPAARGRLCRHRIVRVPADDR